MIVHTTPNAIVLANCIYLKKSYFIQIVLISITDQVFMLVIPVDKKMKELRTKVSTSFATQQSTI